MTGPGFGQTSLFPPEPAPDPLLCWLWLANTLGAGSSHAGRVLDVFGGAQEAWENRDSDAFRKAVGSPAFARANLPDNTPAHYRAFARRCAARNIRILPYDDPDYPLAFSRIPDMPLVLYCTGDPLWLNEPGAVGMVGSRRPTEYGLQAAADLGSGLAKNGAIIVSGLADGLDSAGHRAAVKESCPTIGVLGLRGAAAPAAVRSAPDPMSETERRVLACIGPKAKGVEELGAASGLPTGLLLGTLMKLELAGRVTCLPGKRYILR